MSDSLSGGRRADRRADRRHRHVRCAQKLLKDPIDKLAAYEYDITGTWADPQVAKVESSPGRNAIVPGSERSD